VCAAEIFWHLQNDAKELMKTDFFNGSFITASSSLNRNSAGAYAIRVLSAFSLD